MANEGRTLYSGSDKFWEAYRKGRPQVPDSFFERIYNYHAQHSSGFSTVHDAGAGAGINSDRLAERFDNVLVTDISASNIETAKSHLHGSKYTFRAVKLEDTIDLPAASVDMVYADAMLHFTDLEKAVTAVGHQLKPGGTFAVPLHALPTFNDARLQDRFTALFHTGAEQLQSKFDEDFMAKIAVNGSGYDLVALPETYFLPGSQRIRLNEPLKDITGGGTYYETLIPRQWREQYPPTSRISRTEKIISETDDEWWFRKDIGFLRQLLETFPIDLETEKMKKLWAQLDELVGEREVEGRWVVYLILATRR